MAAFFSVTLAVSVVALVMLIVLKRYEMATGHMILGGLRPTIDRFFHPVLAVVEKGLPRMVGTLVMRTFRSVRTHTQRMLARAILLCEHYLERVLHLVRSTAHVPRGEAASQFLQEVAAHKQKLLKKSAKKRAIFEE